MAPNGAMATFNINLASGNGRTNGNGATKSAKTTKSGGITKGGGARHPLIHKVHCPQITNCGILLSIAMELPRG